MPYVITTRRPTIAAKHFDADESRIVSRRAVATLEEARARLNVTAGLAESERDGAAAPLFAQIDALSESGGTVGPLPDGTVIEVERVSWPALVRASELYERFPSYRHITPSNSTEVERRTVIDAYNARA